MVPNPNQNSLVRAPVPTGAELQGTCAVGSATEVVHMFRSRFVLGLTTAGVLAGVSLTACGSDPDVSAASNKAVDVVAVDYAYKELPAKAKAGTQFSLCPSSTSMPSVASRPSMCAMKSA